MLILSTFIKREDAFEVEYEDLVQLAKQDQTDILAQLVAKSDFEIARKTKVFKNLFSIVDDVRQFAYDYTNTNIHLADIISAMLDAGYSGKKTRIALKKFPRAGTIKAVLAHLILKQKHSLFRKFFKAGEVPFDVLYVKLALENDAFDSLFIIYHAFPTQFTAHLKNLRDSMLTSLSRSPRFYELKLYFLMKMLRHFTYQQCEEALITITNMVSSSNSEENPLLYSTNFLSLGCQTFEVCMEIKEKHPIL